MDLLIEVTKLYSLHKACTILEHGIRDADLEDEWRIFSPSRFVYSFFTFNSIYSINWPESIQEQRAIKWGKDDKGRFYSGSYQFKHYIKFCLDTLGDEEPKILATQLQYCLKLFHVNDWAKALDKIRPSNEDSQTRRYRIAFPNHFDKLDHGQVTTEVHYTSLVSALEFIYRVRNNIFHGSKTRIEMESEDQQVRLLIYSALLIATNGLLFEVIEKKSIGWIRPPFYISALPQS